MDHTWTPTDWAALLVALGTFVNTVLIALAAFLANLAKVRGDVNTAKIDANTELTVMGTTTATNNANEAKHAVTSAATKVEELATQLNGQLDEKIKATIKEYVAPVVEELETLSAYVRERNHNLLDHINNQGLKLERVLVILEKKQPHD